MIYSKFLLVGFSKILTCVKHPAKLISKKNPPQNISLYLHAKSDILEDIGNALHEASAGIVVVGFVSNIFTNIAERR